MSQLASPPDTTELQPVGRLPLGPQEHYDQLNFAHRARVPALEDLKSLEMEYPPVRAINSVVRRMCNLAIVLFAVAVATATVAHRPLLAISIAFGGLASYGFANYAVDRLGQGGWMISAGVALRLTIASVFLSATAFLVAVFG